MIRIQFKHDHETTWGHPVDLGYPDRAASVENFNDLAGEVYERLMIWADAMGYDRNRVAYQILRNDGCVIYKYISNHTANNERNYPKRVNY